MTYRRSTWPEFAKEEQDAVMQVLQSGNVNYWTGKQCRQFEREFADYHHCKYGIALANGTVALELALKSLDVGVGDEVIVPCRTFIASASAVVACGAKPVMADVDLISQNITATTIEAHINAKTKAIIVVHLAGWPCDMRAIMNLAGRYQIKVIEDCAQAHGALYHDHPVGSFGHCATFSFCQDKIITTGGEGGMLLTNDEALWEKAWSYKDHGKNYQQAHLTQTGTAFRFIHERFGSNFRMTEMQAAIGRVQLKKLPQWLTIRQNNAQILNNYLQSEARFRTTSPGLDIKHAYYKYYVFLSTQLLERGIDNQHVLQQAQTCGLPCFSGSCPEIYREQAFSNLKWNIARLPNAMQLGQTSLMLQVDHTLTEKDMSEYAQGLIGLL